jgi:uncharacterized protein YdhG (YjbR/CyaY superfamily)
MTSDIDRIDRYIAEAPPPAQPLLQRIRAIARAAAPDAEESISYRMPAFRGHGILIYIGAFKTHIGVFPPVRGDAGLDKLLAPYRGPKGNLQFRYDAPTPFDLIEAIVKLRVEQDRANAEASRRKRSKRSPA